MPKRFNPPPGWQVPPGFTPPPGWTPKPSWPAPPSGWPLWVDETPATSIRLDINPRWTIGGGAALLIGSLLPSIYIPTNPYGIQNINNGVKVEEIFWGLIIMAFGAAINYKATAGRLASTTKTYVCSILVLALSAFFGLGCLGDAIQGITGESVQTSSGYATVTYLPNIGLILAILGCSAAFAGAIITLKHVRTTSRTTPTVPR